MSSEVEILPDFSPSLEFLYLDDDLVVVNKPSGVLVHPGRDKENEGRPLMKMTRDVLGKRVYPIHRLDRPVSGPVLFLLRPELVKIVQDDWHTDHVTKKYLALVRKHLPFEGAYDIPLDEKPSLTKYRSIGYFDFATLVDVEILTGRMHQIRRHFSRTCNNVAGDTTHGKGDINQLYREKYQLSRIFLHCHVLTFRHPLSGEKIQTNCRLPYVLKNTLALSSSTEYDRLKVDYPKFF